MEGMTVQQIIQVLLHPQSISYGLLVSVQSAVVMIMGTLAVAGTSLWLVNLITGSERLNTIEDLLRLMVMPLFVVALVYPSNVPYLTASNEGLAVGLVRTIFSSTAWITDRVVDDLELFRPDYEFTPAEGKVRTDYYRGGERIIHAKFTEAARGFREVADRALEDLKEKVKKDLAVELKEPSLLEKHPTILSAIVGFVVGALSGVQEASKIQLSISSLIAKKGILEYVMLKGAGTSIKYALTTALMGYAVDLIWRFVIILWIVKVAAILILTPVAVAVGLIAFSWGYSNVGRFLLNVIGIAITPLAMIAILAGGFMAYALSITVVSGLPFLLELLFRLFLSIAFPVLIAMALLRSGEIVSYVIGVSAFMMSSIVQHYSRPTQIIQDVKPVTV